MSWGVAKTSGAFGNTGEGGAGVAHRLAQGGLTQWIGTDQLHSTAAHTAYWPKALTMLALW